MRFGVWRKDHYYVEFEAADEKAAKRICDGMAETMEERMTTEHVMNDGTFDGFECDEPEVLK